MKTACELTREQINELKNNWFWGHIDYGNTSEEESDVVDPTIYGCPENIPDDLVISRYKDVGFADIIFA